MTTSVKVSAHCADTKQVRIAIKNGPETVKDFVIQNGEVSDQVVYDNLVISVSEELKPT